MGLRKRVLGKQVLVYREEAICWLLGASRKCRGGNMAFKLCYELIMLPEIMEMLFEERKKLIKWLKPTELSQIFINSSIQETNRKGFSFFSNKN